MSDHSEKEISSAEEETENIFEEEIIASENDDEIANDNGILTSKRIEIIQDKDDILMATFIFTNEDHTLGNTLRHVLSSDPEVDFVGYSIPHPSESKLNMRLQTKTLDSKIVLKKGLNQISSDCSVLLNKLENAKLNRIDIETELNENKINPEENLQSKEDKKSKRKKKGK